MSGSAKLGRYELLARIATGGMGEIFLARLAGAAGFEKLCVIKKILPHLADDERFRSMLIGEAQIAANMSHANICHVYELDETQRQLYMVMEHLQGATVLQLLRLVSRRGGQLDLGFIAGVLQQVCEGLHYAHELRDRNGTPLNVIHRDITPSNLFLTESGVVKIVDFGIAKAQRASDAAAPGGGATDSGVVKGKYAYMAPEQLRGQPVDRRVDIFSLGVVIFEMVTCRRLFQRKTDYLTFRAVMEQPMIDVRQYRDDAPEALIPVLSRALERDRTQRYSTVRELAGEMLAAFAPVRPWSQSEISDLVRNTFADEMRLYNAEMTRVIDGPDGSSVREIPVIARRKPSTSVPPPSRGEGSSMRLRADVPDGPSAVMWDAGELESVREIGSLEVHNAVPRPSQSVPAARPPMLPTAPPRSSAGPILLVLASAAAVLVGGLWLVGGPLRRTVAGAAPAPAPAPAAGAPTAPERRVRPTEPYGQAVYTYERELDQCARDYKEPLPSDARAEILVGLDGRAKQVTLTPDSAERSQLGGCIRDVLRVVDFPSAGEEKRVALGLAVARY